MANDELSSSNTTAGDGSLPPDGNSHALLQLFKIMAEDSERRERIHEHRTRRIKYGLILVGFVAALVGVHMFAMIHQMSDDMADMRTSMQAMQSAMTSMNTNMSSMTVAIVPMARNMANMDDSMKRITGTMSYMQYDTGLMRQGVIGMSRDTRAMGAPFRVMDGAMPW